MSEFYTKRSLDFTKFRKLWYPDGKKIIPKDLDISPLSLAIWFCNDGCLIVTKQSTCIKIATNGFSKSDVEFLQRNLKDKYDLNIKLCRELNKAKTEFQYFLKITSLFEIFKFMMLIIKYFPDSMNRKLDIWKNNIEYLSNYRNPDRFKFYPKCLKCNGSTCKRGFDKNHNQKYLCKICKFESSKYFSYPIK